MALKRCPICGEQYSDTYRDCPFCEEEEAWEQGVTIRRSTNRRGGRRVKKGTNLLTPVLMVLILVLAGVLVYQLFGDTIADKLGIKDPAGAQVEENLPNNEETEELQPGTEQTGGETNPDSGTPDQTDPVDTTAKLDYAAAAALPAGLKLSTTDFSLFNVGENHTITVSGGNGSYQWFSEDPAVVAVDADGKVMALSRGTIHVVVTDGEKQGTCIVRSQISGAATTTPTTSEGTTSTSALRAGAGKVVNGGNGVRVRAEANTTSEILATLANGADVQIVASAGGDWYKITFAGVGGVTTTGYMKGDFLANK